MKKVLEKQMNCGKLDHILAWKDIKDELARSHSTLKVVNAEYLATKCCIKDEKMFRFLLAARGSDFDIKFSVKKAQNSS